MKPNRIVLECPVSWIKNPNDGIRNKEFFSNVLIAVTSLGLPILVRPTYYRSDSLPRTWGAVKGDLIFSYHTYISYDKRTEKSGEPNVYRLKEAPVPPYYSIDNLGFSGWSSVADSSCYREEIEKISIEEADEIIAEKKEEFLTNLGSKYKQNDTPIPFLTKKYVFFPLQVQNDPVHVLTPFEAIDLVTKAAEVAKEKEILLVLKKHPFDHSKAIENLLSGLSSNPYVRITDGNVHVLNSHAHSVISVNSGSSFEALIVGASVWNSGKSEWWDAVNHIDSLEDIRKAFDPVQPIPTEYQRKLVAFLFKSFWVKNSDLKTITRRITEIVDNYDKNNPVVDTPDLATFCDNRFITIIRLWAGVDAVKRKIRLVKLYMTHPRG